ncbi:MAG TPA: RdgB/HAM1 family non-canonical purine NTP pyrophosphatase [Burkholderiaceae bacterium]|nr:RdgB/HAM1 family non-canonical purine NTP pyrophosphatase [Burkholderiaceae bacterium]
MRLVLASNNAKKLLELQALLAGMPVQLVPQSALRIAEAEEPHGTFVENALAKARHAALQAGGLAIADDSGLCVDALGGEPGVASAHYAPAVADGGDRERRRARQDAANTELLLQRMRAVADRRARFVSTLVALRHAGDPEPLIAQGRWELELLSEPRGSGGFGYDPVVWVPTHGCSVAELEPAVKNQISHRALAACQMRALMQEVWHLG